MAIRKVSQTPPTMASIVNTYSTSEQDGYACDYINTCNTYSTSEIDTGKTWIDGKTIYRKCYTGTIPNDSSVVFSIDDIDRLTNVYGTIEIVAYNKTYTYPLGHYIASSYFSGVQYEYGTTGSSVGLGIWHGSAFNGGTYKIVCEYTKSS